MPNAWSRYLIAVSVLSLIVSFPMYSQTCIGDISLISPAPQSTDIALKPEIILETNMDIVPGTVHPTSPYCSGTSSTCVITVMLLPKFAYENVSEGNWAFWAKEVTCLSLSLRQIKVSLASHASLQYGEEYSLLVRNLNVENQSVPCSDYINQDFSFAFRTIHEPSALAAASIGDQQPISCSDNIELLFKGKVETLQTASGDVVELKRILPTTGTTVTVQTVDVDISCSLDAENEVVTVNPLDDLIPGSRYLLNVHADYLTGNSSDFVTLPFYVRSFVEVSYSTASLSTLHSVTQGDVSLNFDTKYASYFGDDLQLWTPRTIGNLYLKNWTSNIIELDHSTNNIVTVTSSCGTVGDIHLTANYDVIPEDTYEILHSTMGSVDVSGFTTTTPLLGSDSYTFPMNPHAIDEFLTLSALPNPGFVFDRWECPALPKFHNSNDPSIQIVANSVYNSHSSTPSNIHPIFKANKRDDPTAVLNFIIKLSSDSDNAIPLDGIIDDLGVLTWDFVSDSRLEGSIEVPMPIAPVSINASFEILASHTDCFEFSEYRITDGQLGGEKYTGVPLGSRVDVSVVFDNADKDHTITIYLSQKHYTVDVYFEMDDGSALPYSHNVGMDRIDQHNVYYVSEGRTYTGGDLTRVQHRYAYFCGAEPQFKPYVRSGTSQNAFDYKGWQCDPGYRCTDIIAGTPAAIKINLDQDLKVLYHFQGNFRLEQIGYYDTESNSEFTWKNAYGSENVWQNDLKPNVSLTRPIGNLPAQNLPTSSAGLHRTYPRVGLRFSHSLDPNSVSAGSMTIQDINNGARKDGKSNQIYPVSVGFNAALTNNNKDLLIDLFNANEHACHINEMQITLSNNLQSSLGDNLSSYSTGSFQLKTEFPGFYAFSDNYRLRRPMHDNCVGPVMDLPTVIVMGMAISLETDEIAGRNVEVSDEALRFPIGANYGSKTLPIIKYPTNKELLQFTRLKANKVVQHSWKFIDRGNKHLDDKYGEIVDKVADKLSELDLKLLKNAKLASILSDTIKEFVKAGLRCKDRDLDEHEEILSENNNWGTDQLYTVKQRVEFSDAGNFTLELYYAIGDILHSQ